MQVTSPPSPPITSRFAWHLRRIYQEETCTDHSVMILRPKATMIDGAVAMIPPQLAVEAVKLVLKDRAASCLAAQELKGRGRESFASNQQVLSSGSRHLRSFTARNGTRY